MSFKGGKTGTRVCPHIHTHMCIHTHTSWAASLQCPRNLILQDNGKALLAVPTWGSHHRCYEASSWTLLVLLGSVESPVTSKAGGKYSPWSQTWALL